MGATTGASTLTVTTTFKGKVQFTMSSTACAAMAANRTAMKAAFKTWLGAGTFTVSTLELTCTRRLAGQRRLYSVGKDVIWSDSCSRIVRNCKCACHYDQQQKLSILANTGYQHWDFHGL